MALILYFLSYVSLLVVICFVTLSLAAGLYYASEIIEEFSELSKKIIKTTSVCTIALYLLVFVTESFSWILIGSGILAQLLHLSILRNFPVIEIGSLEFCGSVVLLIINHYLAFNHFQEHGSEYTTSEIMGYFTLLVWLVPFALFLSLSANDQTLPSYQEIPSEDDVVTNYFSSRKRKNLLNFFKSLRSTKNHVLPTRDVKKSY